MSEAKHTPGHWQTNGGIVRVADANNLTIRKIATVHGDFGDNETAANARLIAASPDMASAIKAFLNHGSVETIEGLRAALAKADGTS